MRNLVTRWGNVWKALVKSLMKPHLRDTGAFLCPARKRIQQYRQHQHNAGNNGLNACAPAQQTHAVGKAGDHKRAQQRTAHAGSGGFGIG